MSKIQKNIKERPGKSDPVVDRRHHVRNAKRQSEISRSINATNRYDPEPGIVNPKPLKASSKLRAQQ